MSYSRIRWMGIVWMSALFFAGASLGRAQSAGTPPADHPEITVHGRKYTPGSILARNMGSAEDETAQFPPHKIVGNLYYVGTRSLSSFLIVTPQGNILINSTYERNVPTILKSVDNWDSNSPTSRFCWGPTRTPIIRRATPW